jgi:copper chaperone CopZ
MRFSGVTLIFLASNAMACGYCVEDKIAAVYDHAAVTQARAQKHTTVYFAIDGAIRDSRERLQALAEQTRGVLKGSVRVSVDAGALAVSFDPARTPLATLQRALEQKLKGRGLELLLLDTSP